MEAIVRSDEQLDIASSTVPTEARWRNYFREDECGWLAHFNPRLSDEQFLASSACVAIGSETHTSTVT